jgi:regulatory protein YycI of two-component signal transduction system YycFG
MGKFRIIVSVLLMLIAIFLGLIYFEMKYSNELQNIIIEYLYNHNS